MESFFVLPTTVVAMDKPINPSNSSYDYLLSLYGSIIFFLFPFLEIDSCLPVTMFDDRLLVCAGILDQSVKV